MIELTPAAGTWLAMGGGLAVGLLLGAWLTAAALTDTHPRTLTVHAPDDEREERP